MLKKSFQIRYQLEQLLDAVLAALAFSIAIAIRRGLSVWRPDIFPPMGEAAGVGWLYLLIVPLWVFVLDSSNVYQYRAVRTRLTTVSTIIRANFLGVILAFFVLYVLKMKETPRVLIFIYAFIDIVMMWMKEIIMDRTAMVWTPKPNVLLIGNAREFADLLARFKNVPRWSPNVVGLLAPPSVTAERAPEDLEKDAKQVLGDVSFRGSTEDLVNILHSESIDYVVLSPSQEHFDEIQKTINICETEGVETWLLADFFRTSIAQPQVDEFQDLPMVIFRTTPSISWALIIKRIMDLVGSLFLIIILSPLMLAIAASIRLSSPGPIVFRQKRCTLHGREFWMYKFRTMISEAENLRTDLEAHNEMTGPVFKMKDDPRITRLGKFLRRHSLDELPQLFNVLMGDMSLVGPRPPIPAEVIKYENWQRRRLSMRSGITCLWQVSGRNKLGFDEWMNLDLKYIDTWSLALDLKILFKTPYAAVRGTGY